MAKLNKKKDKRNTIDNVHLWNKKGDPITNKQEEKITYRMYQHKRKEKNEYNERKRKVYGIKRMKRYQPLIV
jgi:hypothetical protein